jgi:hypothetical protein
LYRSLTTNNTFSIVKKGAPHLKSTDMASIIFLIEFISISSLLLRKRESMNEQVATCNPHSWVIAVSSRISCLGKSPFCWLGAVLSHSVCGAAEIAEGAPQL